MRYPNTAPVDPTDALAQRIKSLEAQVAELQRNAARPGPTSTTVVTSQSTTSTSFAALTTAGPAVTVRTGTSALVILSAQIAPASGDTALMGFTVSGASSVAAADDSAIGANTDDGFISCARMFRVTGLTAGSNTFTAVYRAALGGAALFRRRDITVVPL